MKRRILSIITALALCLGMCPPVALAADTSFTMSNDLTINSSNKNTYHGKTLTSASTGTTLTIDGTTVDLTISGLNFTGGSAGTIVLKNGATLNLTLSGSNELTGGGSTAGITVPQGCTLTINGGDADSLRVLGGEGGAGIGANYYSGSTSDTVKTVGTIIINGGTITATGSGGGAGIGGTTSGTTGRVTITGGNVTAKGSASIISHAAGIGGGYYGHLESITITGGTVTATGAENSAGIGAGGFLGDQKAVNCGNIKIEGGTVNNTVIGFGETPVRQAGSVTIGENADLPGCTVMPLPDDWASYTFNGTVYDASVTEGASAVFSIGHYRRDVTIRVNDTEPYRGSFSTEVIMQKRDTAEANLALGGKTLPGTGSLADTTVNMTFGTQQYAFYSLDITIYDERVTGDMDTTVSIGGQTLTGQLTKVNEHHGTMRLEKIIFPTASGDQEQQVTVTAGGNTWTGTASTGRAKMLTIGSPAQSATAVFDLSYGDVTFEQTDTIVKVKYHDADGEKSYPLTNLDAVYEVTQSNAATATTNRLFVKNTTTPIHIRIKNINIKTNTLAGSTAKNPPIDITGGKAILEISGDNTVTATGKYTAGVHVDPNSTLKLTGTGKLNATSTDADNTGFSGAGIGSHRDEASGHIVIESGTINVVGGAGGAGIGGGRNGAGNVTINGGEIDATAGSSGSGIGCGKGKRNGTKASADIQINGGIITAETAEYGSGIGCAEYANATIKITGGTIRAACTNTASAGSGIGSALADGSANVTITGGTIQASGKTSAVNNPKNGSGQGLSLVEITLDGVGDNVPVIGVSGVESYGLTDVYTRDGGKLYFYLPDNTRPEKITAGGVDYVPESAGSTTYVVDFQVSLNGYDLTKVYDGKPMQEPTAGQVESNATDLTFAWYQNGTQVSAPVNAGSYTLRVSSGKGSKDFDVTITKRPLTIEAQAQTIDYGVSIAQDAYTQNGLAAGDTLNVTLTASQTAPGTYSGAITISSAAVMRSSTDVTGNYEITSTPGDLTINKIAPTVNSWPTAGEITYGQALSDSTLTGGDTNGTFAWKDGAVKPGAGTAEFDVVFTPTDPNYDTVTGKVSVNVQKAALTVRANGQSVTYGGSIQTGPAQATASGLANGDTLNAVQVSASASARDVGTYTGGITVTDARIARGGKDMTANYEISYEPGDLTISPLAITVTPDSGQHKEYGAADPALTYTATPSLIGDDTFTGALAYSGYDVGEYEITKGTLSAGENYSITVTSGVKFKITKLTLETAEVTLNETGFTYDGTVKEPAVTVVKNGSTLTPGTDFTAAYRNNTLAGTEATVTVTGKGNYEGSRTIKFTITPKELTPSITGTTTKTYDGTMGAPADLSITLDGKVGNDDVTATAASYAYNSPNVNDATTITATGIALDGTAKDNYVLKTNTAEIIGTITKDTSATAPASNEGYTLDYPQETIAIDQGYEVSTAQESGTAVTGSITAHLGQKLYIRKVEDSNHAASEWTEFSVAARPPAPALTKTDETLKGQRNGSISGVNAGMEYSTDSGSTWTACTGTEISGLAGGTTVQVRIKAVEDAPHSEASVYNIGEGAPITVAFDSQGGSAVAALADRSYGDKLEEPEAPTREDYEFQGWYKEAECTTAWDFARDTLTSESVTLYAKWKKVRFTVGGTVKDSDGKNVVGGATVTLMKGSEQIDQGTTDENGSFTFGKHIEAGAYNIVTTYAPEGKSQRIKTTLIALTDSDKEDVAVTLPPEGVNSQLTVSVDTPAVVVGGLDDEAVALKTDSISTVTVSMEVEGKTESQVGATVAEAIKQEAKADPSSGEPMVEYLDISVTKQVDETKEQLTETKNVIEIVVPFDFTGKEDIVVVRYHGNTAEKFTVARDSAKQDKTYKSDKENGYIYIYASKFSTYAVGYTASHTITFDANGGTVTPTEAPTGSNGKLSALPTPTWDGYTFKGWYTSADGGVVVTANTAFTGSTTIYAHWEKKSSQGGGGGGVGGWYPSVSYYSVKVNKSDHGAVTASPTSIYSGGTVTLTVNPDEGYQLEKITVTDSQVKAVEVTEKSGKYTFKMPNLDVTIKADFVPDVSPSPEPTGSPSPSPSESPTPTTSPSPSPDAWKNPFPDVSNTGWYIKAIEYVCTNGLMAGYSNGKFGPNDSLTRAQFAQIIYNREGQPQAGVGKFTDVTTGWYANAVNWAAAEGIVAGVGGGKFAPDQPISRQDLAVMLWRYAGSPEPRKNELDFSDAGKVSTYAWKALCWANENGIVGGKGNRVLDPKGKATRAEAAQMLKNYIEDQKDKS